MEKTATEQGPFSKLHHIGVAVKDLDRAVEYYHSLGMGPFEHKTTSDLIEKEMYGKPIDFKLNIAAAQVGTVIIELIQPMENAPVQEEFLESKGEGINHLGFLVDDIDKEAATLVDKGFEVVLHARRVGRRGGTYLDTSQVGGVLMELIKT